MALVSSTLQMALMAIFTAMDAITDGTGDEYQAAEIAKAIKAYILTGQVTTTDAGAAPAGSYSGAGIGAMTINADALEDDFYTTFTTKYSNDELAAHMVMDIDNACKADKTIVATSNGIVTTGSGATSKFSGPAEGKFSGNKATIENTLKACFAAMNGMTSGGNALYATQFATGMTNYLKAGTITVALKSPFASGSGSGAIAGKTLRLIPSQIIFYGLIKGFGSPKIGSNT
jgi:hypothetical protein